MSNSKIQNLGVNVSRIETLELMMSVSQDALNSLAFFPERKRKVQKTSWFFKKEEVEETWTPGVFFKDKPFIAYSPYFEGDVWVEEDTKKIKPYFILKIRYIGGNVLTKTSKDYDELFETMQDIRRAADNILIL